MVVADHDDTLDAFAQLLETMEHRPTGTETALDEIVASSLTHLRAAQHAGITVALSGGSVRSLSTTDGYPVLLDQIQQRHGEGPCLEAAWEHHLVRVDDIAQEWRWPEYCHDVAELTPIRSILAFQLFTSDKAMGALNFYAERPHAFDDDAVELGLTMATHTALVWHMTRRDEQFRSALASRDIIGQAKGMVMERFDIDAVQAFELLKRLSQNSNTPLIEVARRLVDRTSSGRVL